MRISSTRCSTLASKEVLFSDASDTVGVFGDDIEGVVVVCTVDDVDVVTVVVDDADAVAVVGVGASSLSLSLRRTAYLIISLYVRPGM